MASKITIPPIKPHGVSVTDIGDGEYRILCHHGGIGDGDKLVGYITHEPAEERPYLVDPDPPRGCYMSRRRAATLGEAKTIGRQMAATMLGWMEYQQDRRHAKVVR